MPHKADFTWCTLSSRSAVLLLFKGWTSVGPLYTSCTSFNSNVDMVYYIFSSRSKDTGTFQMPVSFIFAWRLEQQQVTHVSTAISRTVTGKQNSVLSSSPLPARSGTLKQGRMNSHMKVRMMKKAPRSTGLELGRLWSLTHILFKRPSASSLASILRQRRGGRRFQ